VNDFYNAHVTSWLHCLSRALIPYGVRKSDGEWARAHGMRKTFVTPTDMRAAWKEGRWYAPPKVLT